jgi:RNA polymerase-binding transcription factor DksA
VTYAISEPADRADPADLAAAQTETALRIALHQHLCAVEILDDQQIDANGVVHCRACGGPIEYERLAALAPKDSDGNPIVERSTAVRCIGCQSQAEHEQFPNKRRWRP